MINSGGTSQEIGKIVKRFKLNITRTNNNTKPEQPGKKLLTYEQTKPNDTKAKFRDLLCHLATKHQAYSTAAKAHMEMEML